LKYGSESKNWKVKLKSSQAAIGTGDLIAAEDDSSPDI